MWKNLTILAVGVSIGAAIGNSPVVAISGICVAAIPWVMWFGFHLPVWLDEKLWDEIN